MIKEARSDEERNLESSEPTEEETLATLLKEYGGDKLVTQIEDHRTKADTASRELRSLGFICNDRRGVELAYDAPRALKQRIAKLNVTMAQTKSRSRSSILQSSGCWLRIRQTRHGRLRSR